MTEMIQEEVREEGAGVVGNAESDALEEELAELEELDELEEPPKGDGEARLGRASRGYHGGLLRLSGLGPS